MKRRKGIALAVVLIISASLLAILGAGLSLGSNNVLFVSQAHHRNVALSAAEAGVHEAMVAILGDRAFQGPLTGTLSDSQATYTVQVQNNLNGGSTATVVSTGEFGDVQRTLEVELEPDSDGFEGMSLAGKVYVYDQAYVNAISSSDNPIARPGHAHTNFEQTGTHAFVGDDLNADGTVPLLHTTGKLSSKGPLHAGLTRVSELEETNVTKPLYSLDPIEMTTGTFVTAPGLSATPLTTNTEINGDVVITEKVTVPKGVTLVVHGNAEFLGGLTGDGQVVVEGDTIIQTDGHFDPNVKEGIKLYSSESVFITHASAQIENAIITGTTLDPVGDFFAQTPFEIQNELSIDLPTSAPVGGDFFTWFDGNVDSPTQDFALWYNGDGTDIHPGLSQETKAWLQMSRPIHSEISAWVNSSSSSSN